MPSGAELICDIDVFDAAPETAALWWLGQHGFVFKAAGVVVYIDPYLSPSPRRLIPPLLAPAEITNAGLVLGTHDHGDHIDRPAWPLIAQASPHAKFVVPELVRRSLLEKLNLPPEKFIGLD
ncbi:MAG TPA: MBL fold metallo-hydrolase, partial [Planctomycetes bacterium]|nr:MBL fold metallo-hydrolase [Planctomycetota bacterium]